LGLSCKVVNTQDSENVTLGKEGVS
jgi:hypothetical protein